MSIVDFIKAIGLALLLMVLNVAAAFGVVWVYATFVEPGHDEAFYFAAAQNIAPWSSVFVGALLFFLASYWLAWRRTGRNGYLFAASTAAVYATIDLAAMISEGALAAFAVVIAASMLGKFAGALLGAWLARPRS